LADDEPLSTAAADEGKTLMAMGVDVLLF